MASFSMDELRKTVFGDSDVTQRSHSDNPGGRNTAVGRRQKRSIDQTKQLIKNYIHTQKRACLVLEICDHLERKPTPHLRAILTEMVKAGELLIDSDIAPGAVMPRFWYRLP